MNTVEQIRQYIACVYDPDDWVEVRLLKGDDARKRWCRAKDLPSMAAELEQANVAGWNIYAGPNGRKGEKLSGDENVATFRILFLDFDKIEADGAGPSEIVLSRIDGAKLPAPTLVIFSGHGVHCYWRLKNPIDEKRWRNLQERLIQTLGSDPKIKNPERIMRLPGFVNHKPPKAESFIVEVAPETVYPVEAIDRLLPLVTTKPPASMPTKPSVTGGMKTAKARAVLYAAKWETCGEGERNDHAFRHAAQMLRDFDLPEAAAWEILSDWNTTNAPPLDESELRSAFESAKKRAKGTPGSKLAETKPARPRTQLPATAAGIDPASELADLLEAEIDGRFTNLPWPWPELTNLGQCLTPQTRTIIVGSTGGSKSLAVLHALSLWVELGIKVAVLELERSRDFHLARVLAQRAGIADITKPQWVRDNPDRVRALFAEHREYLNRMGAAIHTVPRTFNIVQAAEWVEERATDGCRIIVIDPVTALLRGRDSWVDDEQFVARIEKAARTSGASLVCITNPKKGGNEAPSLDNIAGGAAWTRFPDTVLWLESHPVKLSAIKTACGTDEQPYNRTLWLLKTRSGEGEHLRLAYKFQTGKDEHDDGALTLRELGIIVKRK
jgi:hypothetical protein